VWDEHVDPFTNTVLVTISRLRRKLGDPTAIETVRASVSHHRRRASARASDRPKLPSLVRTVAVGRSRFHRTCPGTPI